MITVTVNCTIDYDNSNSQLCPSLPRSIPSIGRSSAVPIGTHRHPRHGHAIYLFVLELSPESRIKANDAIEGKLLPLEANDSIEGKLLPLKANDAIEGKLLPLKANDAIEGKLLPLKANYCHLRQPVAT
ncbi:hypothetical protein QE152_g32242 [Popillia japonica]|uniref:Uncharacterized protein n=1 Tax=Popillia japonica TaxID=7064 RepID=A0AAW1IZP3_POPJA